MIVELNEENFDKETQSGLKLVDFYTTWCKFCQNQDIVLKELGEGEMWIGKIDCDKFSNIAARYGISGFPSFILFKNGEIAAQFSGYHTKTQLLNRLSSCL